MNPQEKNTFGADYNNSTGLHSLICLMSESTQGKIRLKESEEEEEQN